MLKQKEETKGHKFTPDEVIDTKESDQKLNCVYLE